MNASYIYNIHYTICIYQFILQCSSIAKSYLENVPCVNSDDLNMPIGQRPCRIRDYNKVTEIILIKLYFIIIKQNAIEKTTYQRNLFDEIPNFKRGRNFFQ